MSVLWIPIWTCRSISLVSSLVSYIELLISVHKKVIRFFTLFTNHRVCRALLLDSTADVTQSPSSNRFHSRPALCALSSVYFFWLIAILSSLGFLIILFVRYKGGWGRQRERERERPTGDWIDGPGGSVQVYFCVCMAENNCVLPTSHDSWSKPHLFWVLWAKPHLCELLAYCLSREAIPSSCQNPIPASVAKSLAEESFCQEDPDAGSVISPTSTAEEWSSVPDDSDTWGSQNDGLSHLPPWRQNSMSEVPVSSLLSALAACAAAAWVSPVPCHLLGGPVEYGTQGAARKWGALFAGNPNLFLLTVSLRYSLHTTKFSYFKYTIQ